MHLRRCHKVWGYTRSALLRSAENNQRIANRHRTPASAYKPGQKLWLSSKHIPIKTESEKLAQRYVGPFVVEKISNPTALRLELLRTMRVHPTFHESQLKPVSTSPLCPPPVLPPPTQMINGYHANSIQWLLDVRRHGRSYLDWEGYGPEESRWVLSVPQSCRAPNLAFLVQISGEHNQQTEGFAKILLSIIFYKKGRRCYWVGPYPPTHNNGGSKATITTPITQHPPKCATPQRYITVIAQCVCVCVLFLCKQLKGGNKG